VTIVDADEFGSAGVLKESLRRLPMCQRRLDRSLAGRGTKSAFARIASIAISLARRRAC